MIILVLDQACIPAWMLMSSTNFQNIENLHQTSAINWHENIILPRAGVGHVGNIIGIIKKEIA